MAHKKGRHTSGEPAGRVKGYAAHFRERMVKCGKKNCPSCPHGPYRYKLWRDEDGRLREKYIGRVDDEGED